MVPHKVQILNSPGITFVPHPLPHSKLPWPSALFHHSMLSSLASEVLPAKSFSASWAKDIPGLDVTGEGPQ